ncbi:TRAP transporter large permease subunit [Pandoraea cepalis]|uniref:Sialic acid TRAP transporter permease protein SiaT n=1 Tax=Pandoraea cepalis TaxID=2508294 RepID=A0A5E4VPK1_9BURK|nr:TRAP transporter large permease subunit [Pandoraea cepalis]VVE12980.1 Sialic acid TRAP transporter permease protein SiaT [Pandoraea cepalis]
METLSSTLTIGRRTFADSCEHVLLRCVEIVASIILVGEIGILATGVIARYVLDTPITWSDELASILFIWLSMLGASIAFQRGQHMRMTALVGRSNSRNRRVLETIALAVPLAFMVAILLPAIDYAMEEAIVTTPALEISNLWRSAALPTGVALMIVFAAFRILKERMFRSILIAAVVAIAVYVLLTVAKPIFTDLGNWNLLIFFVGMIGLGVALGVPIAFVFALSAIAYVFTSTSTPAIVLAGRLDEGMSHLILLAVPLFVFLGLQIESNGMARAMVGFLATLLGHVRGGLSYVLVGAMYLVSGISGSKTADMAAVAPALFPEMQQRGAKPGDLVALLAATGAQTETVPPSIVLITIGSVTGVSISALFTGGLLPSVVLGITLCTVVWWRYKNEDLSSVKKTPKAKIAKAFIVALPALALPFVIRAAVVEGMATATEVSTIGIIYSLVVGAIVYRHFDIKRLGQMLVETVSLSGAILFIIGGATTVAWSLTQSGFSQDLAALMSSLPGGPAMFIAVSIVAFVILGSVLEGIPAIVLFAPLVFPIAKSLGVNEVHYAMIVVLSMGMGLFMPPVGVGYYAACAVARVEPSEGLRPIWGYMIALFVGLVLVAMIPWLSIGFL